MRRVAFTGVALVLLAPTLLVDGSGQQLGLGLYVAFIGVPGALACLTVWLQ